MIKKIEAWFRKIVSEEVKVCRDDFHVVTHWFESETEAIETKFTADLKKFEGTFEQALEGIENRLKERLDQLVIDTLERIDQKVKLIDQSISKELDHWKADEEVRKSDEALIHTKPKRR